MNRQERRRRARDRKRWLASVPTDPRITHEELLVAQWIAENADDDGRIVLPDLDEEEPC